MDRAIKERGILFSAPMVRALLNGTKTQTRRIVKGFALELLQPENFTPEYVALPENGNSPYGYAGERLWVRETFFAYGRWVTRYSEKKQRDEWHFIDMTAECDRAYQYAASNPDVPLAKGRGGMPGWYTRPAIHIPHAASRILLEITSVRVERLQEIGEADALAEGIISHVRGGWHWHKHDPSNPDDWHQFGFNTAAFAYQDLWESINGAGSWDANPWVWRIAFRAVDARGGQHADQA